jgi:hypothetical protein
MEIYAFAWVSPTVTPFRHSRTAKTSVRAKTTVVGTTTRDAQRSRVSPTPPEPSPSPWWTSFLTPLMATTPILSGLARGLGLLVLAGEGGWSCRHVLLLCMLASWLTSSAVSSLPDLFLKRSISRRNNTNTTISTVPDRARNPNSTRSTGNTTSSPPPTKTNTQGTNRRGSLYSLYQTTTSQIHSSYSTPSWRRCLAKDIALGLSISSSSA